MTKLGLYLAKRSINKSDLARKIGVTKQRIDKLTNNEKSKLLANEAYLIAAALKIDIAEFMNDICKDSKLKE